MGSSGLHQQPARHQGHDRTISRYRCLTAYRRASQLPPATRQNPAASIAGEPGLSSPDPHGSSADSGAAAEPINCNTAPAARPAATPATTAGATTLPMRRRLPTALRPATAATHGHRCPPPAGDKAPQPPSTAARVRIMPPPATGCTSLPPWRTNPMPPHDRPPPAAETDTANAPTRASCAGKAAAAIPADPRPDRPYCLAKPAPTNPTGPKPVHSKPKRTPLPASASRSCSTLVS